MSDSLVIDVAELTALGVRFDGADRIVTDELTTAGQASGYLVQASAVAGAPRDLGQLVGSIGPPSVGASAGSVVTELRATAAHARHQEEGTGTFAGRGRIYPRSGKFLSWVGKDGRRVFARSVAGTPPTWYMRNALRDNQSRIEQLHAEAVRRVVARLAGAA